MRRVGLAVAAVLVVSVVAGCAISGEREARPIEPPAGPYANLTPFPAEDTQPGSVPMHLYLTRDGTLVAVTRQADHAVDLPAVMDALLAGPTETEQTQGIGSALPGANLINQVRLHVRTAQVTLAAPLEDTGRSDVSIAIAQVVCTLDARPEVDGVEFIRDGEVVAVPRHDGALAKGPLTMADYDCPVV